MQPGEFVITVGKEKKLVEVRGNKHQ